MKRRYASSSRAPVRAYNEMERWATELLKSPYWVAREAFYEKKLAMIRDCKAYAVLLASLMEPWWRWTAHLLAAMVIRDIEALQFRPIGGYDRDECAPSLTYQPNPFDF